MKLKLFPSMQAAKEVLRPGKLQLARVGDRELCILLFSGKIHCFENKCPHLGAQLHKGHINHLGEVICPLHTYRFELTHGNECQSRCGNLKTHRLLEQGDGLFVEI